jgi:curved DNA-binding protein CbpA
MFGAAKREKAFKDYCLILQVHPEADAAMIDAAYWHLAKRYNEATAFDPKARAKIEELNEAYIVLGSAEKREEYMKLRAQVLGEGALPQVPRPEPPVPPLTVMTRQRPQERPQSAEANLRRPFARRFLIGVLVTAGVAGVALAATLSLLVASAAVAAILAVLLAVAGILAALPRLRRSEAPWRPRSNVVGFPAMRPTAHTQPATSHTPSQTPGAASGKPGAESAVEDEQVERLKAETQKLRATAKTGTSVGSPPKAGPQEPTPPGQSQERVDRAQIEQIKREAQQLRSRAKHPAEAAPTSINDRVDRADIERIKQEAEALRAAQRRSDPVNKPRQSVDDIL